MLYTKDQSSGLADERDAVVSELQCLHLQIVAQGQTIAEPRVREHLLHGAGRRVGVMKRSIKNVFTIFPPETERPLSAEDLADVQINLHAFVINLYGVYDNLAWAFVLRHDLEVKTGGRKGIGLFNSSTHKHLPLALRQYLSSGERTQWHEKYVKNYRDALAHRIPLYIPPAEFTSDEGARYNELEAEKISCIKAMQWERLDEVYVEQATIGVPCFTFLHAFSEDTPPCPVLLHPQMLSDGRAVVECGNTFLKHWHEGA